MKEIYHLSLSSHQEVMYRDEADLNRGFNCLAEACMETDSILLAESFLTTHHHEMVLTDCLKEIFHRQRYAYVRYFNARHGRRGSLGEKVPFTLKIEGLYHTTVALNYVFRQGLHHGLAASAFGYPHGSANAIFRKDLGRPAPLKLMPATQRYKYLPDRSSVPPGIRMSTSGLLLREDVIDTSYVEKIYTSPRNFLFQMNKISDQKWIDEQLSDKTSTPVITLELIESGVHGLDVAALLRNEQGKVNTSRMTDLELCRIIDEEYLPGMARGGRSQTVYGLSRQRRADLGNRLWKDIPCLRKKFVTEAQLRRCICLDY
ncbi:MAG: hypothetical protein IJ636_03170 [Bacteroidales bacterium]|nr:hypothetical protein [Bacteroidales bacterium]